MLIQSQSAPAFSMGARTKYRKRDAVPAPNTYSLPVTVGDAPKYTMGARPKIGGFAEDLAKAPAPGAYSVPDPAVVDKKAPAFTMQGRTFMPTGEDASDSVLNVVVNECFDVLCVFHSTLLIY